MSISPNYFKGNTLKYLDDLLEEACSETETLNKKVTALAQCLVSKDAPVSQPSQDDRLFHSMIRLLDTLDPKTRNITARYVQKAKAAYEAKLKGMGEKAVSKTFIREKERDELARLSEKMHVFVKLYAEVEKCVDSELKTFLTHCMESNPEMVKHFLRIIHR